MICGHGTYSPTRSSKTYQGFWCPPSPSGLMLRSMEVQRMRQPVDPICRPTHQYPRWLYEMYLTPSSGTCSELTAFQCEGSSPSAASAPEANLPVPDWCPVPPWSPIELSEAASLNP